MKSFFRKNDFLENIFRRLAHMKKYQWRKTESGYVRPPSPNFGEQDSGQTGQNLTSTAKPVWLDSSRNFEIMAILVRFRPNWLVLPDSANWILKFEDLRR